MTEDENQLGAAGNSAEEAAADSYGSDDTMSEAEATEQADTETAAEAEASEQADNETAAEGEASEQADTETAAEEKPRKYHAPLYIAACIFLAAVIFFGVKLCFFNTNIEGIWGLDVKTLDGKNTMHFNLNFKDEKVRLQTSNTVYIGRLSLKEEDGSYMKSDDGKPMLMMNMNLNGKPFVYKFNYEFGGNVFTGRTLQLTDLSGLFYEPDLKSGNAEEIKKRKKNTGFIETKDKIYYVWSLTPSEENAKPAAPKNFKEDKKLTGSWLLKKQDTVYPYTLNFSNDGTFCQLSHELEIYGTYSLKDNVCTLNWKEIGSNEKKSDLKYSVDNNKLTLSQEYEGVTIMSIELKKTKDKYDFKDGTD